MHYYAAAIDITPVGRSAECILRQACMSVCPEQALELSFGLEVGGKERLGEIKPKVLLYSSATTSADRS